MINQDLEFDDMAETLQPLISGWEDTIVPRDVDLVSNPRYSPRYAWMFSYERRLRDRIFEGLGRKVPSLERDLFGADGVVSEGLSNAFVHGHRRDPERPITVRCVVGITGLALSIIDSGPGFDVEELLNMVEKNAKYFHQAGNGMKALLAKEGITASVTDGGRTLNLLYGFGQVP
jgi:anti-sigma regulatory factor (Ser/Thr protein kinase)